MIPPAGVRVHGRGHIDVAVVPNRQVANRTELFGNDRRVKPWRQLQAIWLIRGSKTPSQRRNHGGDNGKRLHCYTSEKKSNLAHRMTEYRDRNARATCRSIQGGTSISVLPAPAVGKEAILRLL